jgi:flagellar M-ring protein FliF
MADATQSAGQVGRGGGAGQQALDVVNQARTRFSAMPAQRRTWLLAGVALLAAVAAGLFWFAQRPDWRPLFNGLESKDLQQVSQELAAAGVPFQVTSDGAGIEVPAEVLDKARMEVAAKGMPQSGRLGFELFDKPNWVGSEFDERVNYQRALEGELEHTIGTIAVVRSARVHLVLPKESLFVGEERTAKASVVLKLKKSSLAPDQVESIRNLVAGAVENLNPAQVTLVDADGRVNLDGHGQGAAQADIEQAAEAKLVAMLEPLAGAGNVRATVNATYDQSSEEHTDEVFDPNLSATLTVQKSEQINQGNATHPTGVPGTASNTPASAPAGAVQGSAKAAAPGTPPLLPQKAALPVYPDASAGAGSTTKQESGSYAVTKHTTHTELAPGRLRRITAAVLINDRQIVEGNGKLEHLVWKPRTAEEMRRLNGLAQAAVGYDEKRGDQVVIENVSFSSNLPEVKLAGLDRILEQTTSFLQLQQGALRTVVLGLIALLVVWFVLKPVASQVVLTLKEPVLHPLPERAAAGSLGGGSEYENALEDGYASGSETSTVLQGNELMAGGKPDWIVNGRAHGGGADGTTPKPGRVHIYDQVADHVRREPTESTRLLAAWIGGSEDGE